MFWWKIEENLKSLIEIRVLFFLWNTWSKTFKKILLKDCEDNIDFERQFIKGSLNKKRKEILILEQ